MVHTIGFALAALLFSRHKTLVGWLYLGRIDGLRFSSLLGGFQPAVFGSDAISLLLRRPVPCGGRRVSVNS